MKPKRLIQNDDIILDGTGPRYQKEAEAFHKLWEREEIEEEFEIDSIEDLRDRLTKYKFLANHGMSCVDVNAYNLMLEDLNEYHSIEKELGIDLATLFKANNEGAYFKEDLRHYIANIDLKHKCVRLVKHYEAEDDFDCHYVMFKDYGKTWALTREELE